MAELTEQEADNFKEPTDLEYTVMITMLRIYDALGALLEEIRPGAGKQLFDIHSEGKLIMPEPAINGKFAEGFGSEAETSSTNSETVNEYTAGGTA